MRASYAHVDLSLSQSCETQPPPSLFNVITLTRAAKGNAACQWLCLLISIEFAKNEHGSCELLHLQRQQVAAADTLA